MNNGRSIRKIVQAQRVQMGDVWLYQAIPLQEVDMVDPFLLIHHWMDTLPGGQKQSEVGVGPHPHRGFAPVTFVFKGAVHHRDSLGHDAVVEAGGTQWMHSGSGLVHSERPGKEAAENGGEFEIIQFWVNSPAEQKMEPPYYKPLQANETPVVTVDGGEIAVVAGEYHNTQGAITPITPQLLLRLDLNANSEVTLPIPESYNALLYVLDGEVELDNKTMGTRTMAWFNSDGTGVTLRTRAETRAILLSGEPINEPVATYGPFVMNTQSELITAMQDYQTGRMGDLEEVFD